MSPTREEIGRWCQEYVADVLEVAPESIELDTDFDRLGVDSALAASLLIDVEEHYGVELPPEVLFDNPNLNTVVEYLHTHAQQHVA